MYTVNNLNAPARLEAKGLAKCWEAYAQFAAREPILEVGFNNQSGYVYIALEYGLTICSLFGQDVEYLVTDFENGRETFFDNYEDAYYQMEME